MPLLNEQFYANLDAKIDAIPSEAEAELFVRQAFEPIQQQLDATLSKVVTPLMTQLNAYIGEAALIQNVLNPPSDPMAIIPWVQAVVQVFTARAKLIKTQIQPYLTQYQAAQEIVSGMPAEVSKLQNHFNSKMQEKGWNVSAPSITFPTLPALPPIPPIIQ